MTSHELEEILQESFTDAKIEVIDTTGTGDHFALVISSNFFSGMPLIKQHRLVLSALTPFMENNGGPIHAVDIKTHKG